MKLLLFEMLVEGNSFAFARADSYMYIMLDQNASHRLKQG